MKLKIRPKEWWPTIRTIWRILMFVLPFLRRVWAWWQSRKKTYTFQFGVVKQEPKTAQRRTPRGRRVRRRS